MKKILFTICCFATLSASLIASADDTNENYQPAPEQNYIAVIAPIETAPTKYIGLNVGAVLSSVKRNITIGSFNHANQGRIFGYTGGIYSGYGANLGNLYLATELGAFFNSLNREFSQDVGGRSTRLTVQQPLIIAFDILPGYLTRHQDYLVYGRLGIAGSLMKLDLLDSSVPFSSTTNEQIVFGWRAGMGLQYFFSNFFSMRLEYIYSKYNRLKGSVTNRDTNYTFQGRAISVNQINLGITLHF